MPGIDKELVLSHVITAEAEGRAINPVTLEELSKADFENHIERILEQADRENDANQGRKELAQFAGECSCLDRSRSPGQVVKVRRLLIHVHGGMNAPADSLGTAEKMVRLIENETGGDWYYPIFFTWPSGSTASYGEHLFTLRQGQHTPVWGAITSPVYLAVDLAGGIVRTPRSWSFQALNDSALAAKVAFDWDLLPTWRSARGFYEGLHGLDNPPFDVSLGEYRRGPWTQAGHFLWYWSTFPMKLFTTATVIDAMGRGSWDVMLHRSNNVFLPAAEFEERRRLAKNGKLREMFDQPVNGAFAIFLRKLLEHIQTESLAGEQSHAAGSPGIHICYQITLVGHSMGAIVINNALRLFPELPVSRIVYMAPACSIAEAEQMVVPFLTLHKLAKFHVLTLHPLAEADEINAYDLVPRGSLLEWIDNWYTSPAGPMERRLGKWINLMQALHVFKKVSERMTLKAFGVDGDTIPQKHGDFNDCPFWRKLFWLTSGPLTYPRDWAGE